MCCDDCGRPKLLDLFSCAGGAGRGYALAGFCVTGVDLSPQPRYPFRFHQADAIEFLKEYGHEFAAVHASPPCQAYSRLKSLHTTEHPELVGPTRDALVASGLPFIIENVVGAPLVEPLLLCGTEFDLGAECRDGEVRQLQRHRLFESNVPLVRKRGCRHVGQAVGVYGHGGGSSKKGFPANKDEAEQALGITWMTRAELSQAIPPAYTHWLGGQLLATI